MPTIVDSKIYSPEFRNISFDSTATPPFPLVSGGITVVVIVMVTAQIH